MGLGVVAVAAMVVVVMSWWGRDGGELDDAGERGRAAEVVRVEVDLLALSHTHTAPPAPTTPAVTASDTATNSNADSEEKAWRDDGDAELRVGATLTHTSRSTLGNWTWAWTETPLPRGYADPVYPPGPNYARIRVCHSPTRLIRPVGNLTIPRFTHVRPASREPYALVHMFAPLVGKRPKNPDGVFRVTMLGDSTSESAYYTALCSLAESPGVTFSAPHTRAKLLSPHFSRHQDGWCYKAVFQDMDVVIGRRAAAPAATPLRVRFSLIRCYQMPHSGESSRKGLKLLAREADVMIANFALNYNALYGGAPTPEEQARLAASTFSEHMTRLFSTFVEAAEADVAAGKPPAAFVWWTSVAQHFHSTFGWYTGPKNPGGPDVTCKPLAWSLAPKANWWVPTLRAVLAKNVPGVRLMDVPFARPSEAWCPSSSGDSSSSSGSSLSGLINPLRVHVVPFFDVTAPLHAYHVTRYPSSDVWDCLHLFPLSEVHAPLFDGFVVAMQRERATRDAACYSSAADLLAPPPLAHGPKESVADDAANATVVARNFLTLDLRASRERLVVDRELYPEWDPTYVPKPNEAVLPRATEPLSFWQAYSVLLREWEVDE